ncbi:hypothetical protein F5Y03DRAFT_354098 [Xylaria venustula]|nr:hypothetical protein F5Y03DRAFT_354098 [Xylaria venustula]
MRRHLVHICLSVLFLPMPITSTTSLDLHDDPHINNYANGNYFPANCYLSLPRIFIYNQLTRNMCRFTAIQSTYSIT